MQSIIEHWDPLFINTVPLAVKDIADFRVVVRYQTFYNFNPID
jgi:hypothetical protein